MQSRIWLINIVLLILVLVFGIRIFEVWFKPDKQKIAPKSSQVSSAQPEVKLMPKTAPPQASYQIIAEKTIFSPDRAEQTKKAEAASSAPKTPAKFNVWGVMILSDSDKRALISDVAPNPKKRWVKEGDTLDDRKVLSVQKDRVVLAGKDDKQEIMMYDSAKVVRRDQIKKDQEPTVIAGLGDNQGQQALKGEKPLEIPVAAAEKKPEIQTPDKKTPDPQPQQAREKSKQPDPPKPQPMPPAVDSANPFLNLFKGIK